jgi:hypothetical protein
MEVADTSQSRDALLAEIARLRAQLAAREPLAPTPDAAGPDSDAR